MNLSKGAIYLCAGVLCAAVPVGGQQQSTFVNDFGAACDDRNAYQARRIEDMAADESALEEELGAARAENDDLRTENANLRARADLLERQLNEYADAAESMARQLAERRRKH